MFRSLPGLLMVGIFLWVVTAQARVGAISRGADLAAGHSNVHDLAGRESSVGRAGYRRELSAACAALGLGVSGEPEMREVFADLRFAAVFSDERVAQGDVHAALGPAERPPQFI